MADQNEITPADFEGEELWVEMTEEVTEGDLLELRTGYLSELVQHLTGGRKSPIGEEVHREAALYDVLRVHPGASWSVLSEAYVPLLPWAVRGLFVSGGWGRWDEDTDKASVRKGARQREAYGAAAATAFVILSDRELQRQWQRLGTLSWFDLYAMFGGELSQRCRLCGREPVRLLELRVTTGGQRFMSERVCRECGETAYRVSKALNAKGVVGGPLTAVENLVANRRNYRAFTAATQAPTRSLPIVSEALARVR